MFSFGDKIRMTVFGASHNSCVGVTVDGLPAGLKVDFDKIRALLDRRKPNKSIASTARNEDDEFEIISGLFNGLTCGSPLTAIFKNKDIKSSDYRQDLVRPGHSDYPAFVKYNGFNDYRGGGSFSGRMTAAFCFAGGIALQMLEDTGIHIRAEIVRMGNVEEAIGRGDSVGGIIKCTAENIPVGLGEPIFNSVESVISHALFSIPAVKAVEFGAGKSAADMTGSRYNDAYYIENGKITAKTNNAGGILGGLTNGMPIEVYATFRPAPSIFLEQDTVNLSTMQNEKLTLKGRHDVCIVPRALPVVESMVAFTLLNFVLPSLRAQRGNPE
jgi:chorismate synthase